MRLVVPALLAVCTVTAAAACRRSHPHPATQSDDDDKPTPHAAPVIPAALVQPCTLDATRWRVPVAEAPGGATVEGGALLHTDSGDWIAWLDRVTNELVVSGPAGSPARISLNQGDTEAPVLAASGSGAVVASVVQRPAGRVHRVLLARAGLMRELFTQPETADDGLSIAIAATSSGVLVAWDDDLRSHNGAIVSQFVPHDAIVAGNAIPSPPTRVLTPPEHDAANPVLIPLPNGTLILAWLASQDVDADIANQTTSDVYVEALSASGVPVTQPVKISPGPGNRFGVAGLARASGLWLAYRVAGDADQESQGDGGAIAVVRLGADLHPTALPAYVTGDGSPSGVPALISEGMGVTAFWTERDGEGAHTLRRSVEPDGTVTRPAVAEPALAGDLPVYGDGGQVVLLRHGPHGEPGTAGIRCPAIPVPTHPVDGGSASSPPAAE